MALRDTWHRALVYFGLAEDHYGDVEEEYYEPETGSEDVFAESGGAARETREEAPARRLGRRGRGGHSDDEIDDIFPDDEPAPSRRSRGGGGRSRDREAGGGGAPVLEAVDTGSDAQVHMVTPRNFNDAQQVGDQFKRSVPVIINLQTTDKELAKRLIDFASGLTYALGGGMQRIAEKVFLLTPANVEVSADEKERILERGFFNQS